MRAIALADLAIAISSAGGIGFIGAGNNANTLITELSKAKKLQAETPNLSHIKDLLPIGVGIFLWAGPELLKSSLPAIAQHRPAAVWLYAANHLTEAISWTHEIRHATAHQTSIWIQIGSVQEAISYTRACQPDVLVIQGQDAGGHGLEKCAGILALFPEVDDAITSLCEEEQIPKPLLIAAGGIVDGRGAAAALALGAQGVCMGTRYLASPEAQIAAGYREAVVAASDGGQTTKRTKLYDTLRGTLDWPERYGGRGVLNESFRDAEKGMSVEENRRLYEGALGKGDEGWGVGARLTTYAGTGVGLVKGIMGAGEITTEAREESRRTLRRVCGRL